MNDDQNPISWRLRELMASRGMFQTTDLIGPLLAAGVRLSREQVFRLVTKPPLRLNVEVLVALCSILECTPNDLIEIRTKSVPLKRQTGTLGRESESSIGELRPITARIHRPSL